MDLSVDEMNKCLDIWASLFIQSNLQKFFEDLFGHVSLTTEGLYYTSQLDYLPLAMELYQKDIGDAIIRILSVSSVNIEKLFESIKEKIQVRENLKSFLVCLIDKFLCGQPQHELYFLTIASRIFALVFRTSAMSPDVFIEELVETVMEYRTSEVERTKSLPALNIESLIGNILINSNSIDEFRNLKCGEVSDYFPA